MRSFEIIRKTNETNISLSLNLDGGEIEVNSGCGFLDHMLVLFASHGQFGLKLKCVGDTQVDYHHITEDIGLCLGLALKGALGDKGGIIRYGDIILPMDEALIMCAVDISGRSHLTYDVKLSSEKVGDFDTELVKEFLLGCVRTAGICVHLRQLAGENSHHILEGVFKALARALSTACIVDERLCGKPASTKGVL